MGRPPPPHFLQFSLPNVLRVTTACTFSTSQLPKVLQDRQFLINTFYFQMFFVPQRCALFPHVNFQKWSQPIMLWHFSLRSVTTACNFSSPICPDVSAPAALASLLFDPPEPRNIGKHWKNTVFHDFPTFAHNCIFSLLTFSLSDLLSSNFLPL